MAEVSCRIFDSVVRRTMAALHLGCMNSVRLSCTNFLV